MSPALKALAERAIAAGAPEADDHTIIVVPGVSFRSVLTGLVYDRLTRLPLLSDPSWLGWVLDEVSRRGYDYCMDARPTSVSWLAIRRGPVPSEGGGSGVAADRPEALVSLLEATRTKSTP